MHNFADYFCKWFHICFLFLFFSPFSHWWQFCCVWAKRHFSSAVGQAFFPCALVVWRYIWTQFTMVNGSSLGIGCLACSLVVLICHSCFYLDSFGGTASVFPPPHLCTWTCTFSRHLLVLHSRWEGSTWPTVKWQFPFVSRREEKVTKQRKSRQKQRHLNSKHECSDHVHTLIQTHFHCIQKAFMMFICLSCTATSKSKRAHH